MPITGYASDINCATLSSVILPASSSKGRITLQLDTARCSSALIAQAFVMGYTVARDLPESDYRRLSNDPFRPTA